MQAEAQNDDQAMENNNNFLTGLNFDYSNPDKLEMMLKD